MSRIVISDPHGCYKTLMALIAQLPVGVPITFAGDLVDRGPDSNKIVKFVRDNGYDCVMGNHELMMIQELQILTNYAGLEIPYVNDAEGIWSMNGGSATLYSYLTEKVNEMGDIVKTREHDMKTLKEDLEWMKTLPYYIEYKDLKNDRGQHLLVTHSSAAEVWGKHSPESAIFQNAVVWDRTNFPAKIDGIYNLFGHTPQQYKATVKEHFANIDTGAYFKREPYGRMTALMFPDMVIYTQKNVEDVI